MSERAITAAEAAILEEQDETEPCRTQVLERIHGLVSVGVAPGSITLRVHPKGEPFARKMHLDVPIVTDATIKPGFCQLKW